MIKTAFVTGGTRGIGAAIARQLKEEGYNVIVSYKENAENASLFFEQTRIPTYRFDIADAKQTKEAMHCILQEHGDIEVLIHNAGITRDGFFHKMTCEMWNDVICTNLMSCFYVIHPVIQRMRDRRYGRIICLSSLNAQKGQIGQTNYSAAKAGILGFVKSLALENVSRGITVNAITPGYIDTDMVQHIPKSTLNKIVETIPIQRLGKPQEVARLVSFLVHESSSYITGSIFPINGGSL